MEVGAGRPGSHGMSRTSSFDEEAELSEFIPDDLPVVASTGDGAKLTFLARLLDTLDHPRYRAMSPGKQQLYLQLLRWSYGKELKQPDENEEENTASVTASRLEMSGWTGLAWDTVKKYMAVLMDEGLVTIINSATPTEPAMYSVSWLPPPPRLALEKQVTAEGLSFYVDQLDEVDNAEYQRLSRLLEVKERQQLHSEVQWSLRDLGLPWNYELIQKLIKWQFLLQSPYRRTLESKYPAWFRKPAD